MRKRLCSTLLTAALLGASVTIVTTGTAAGGEQRLDWHRCAPDKPANFQCATVRVPLDYRKPNGRKIDIAISRLPAREKAKRRGVLLMNPGGPGSAGLDMPAGYDLPEQVSSRYDLIGFDPRGVGASTPVSCGLDKGGGWFPIPFDRRKFAAHVAETRAIADRCAANAADLLPYITTRNTARDMDRIRAVLGEEKLSYYGISYGTYLGTVYTQLFPGRTDRIVLDSNIDPDRVWRGMVRIWALAAQRAFDMFAGWAAQRHDTYLLGATAKQVDHTVRKLLDRLDRKPAMLNGERYDGNKVRFLARGIGKREADNKTFATLIRNLVHPHSQAEAPETTSLEPPADNADAGLLAVLCGDARWPRDVRQYRADAIRDSKRFPLMGGQTANISPCAFWPAPREPRTRIRHNRAPSVLLVQDSLDMQTPVEGARTLRRLLPNSRMVLVDGSWRHGAYPGNCADPTVTRYLSGGPLPDKDKTCRSTE